MFRGERGVCECDDHWMDDKVDEDEEEDDEEENADVEDVAIVAVPVLSIVVVLNSNTLSPLLSKGGSVVNVGVKWVRSK